MSNLQKSSFQKSLDRMNKEDTYAMIFGFFMASFMSVCLFVAAHYLSLLNASKPLIRATFLGGAAFACVVGIIVLLHLCYAVMFLSRPLVQVVCKRLLDREYLRLVKEDKKLTEDLFGLESERSYRWVPDDFYGKGIRREEIRVRIIEIQTILSPPPEMKSVSSGKSQKGFRIST